MNINIVNIQGRLTADPVYDKTVKGSTLAKFGIAHNEYAKQGDSIKTSTSFFDVVVFGKEAEYCQKRGICKGQDLLITGRLQQSRWETDGQKKSRVQLIANNILVIQHEAKSESEPDVGDSWGQWEE